MGEGHGGGGPLHPSNWVHTGHLGKRMSTGHLCLNFYMVRLILLVSCRSSHCVKSPELVSPPAKLLLGLECTLAYHTLHCHTLIFFPWRRTLYQQGNLRYQKPLYFGSRTWTSRGDLIALPSRSGIHCNTLHVQIQQYPTCVCVCMYRLYMGSELRFCKPQSYARPVGGRSASKMSDPSYCYQIQLDHMAVHNAEIIRTSISHPSDMVWQSGHSCFISFQLFAGHWSIDWHRLT